MKRTLALALAVSLFGCGGGDDDDVLPPEDLEAPTIAVEGLSSYQVVAGTLEIAVTAADDIAVAKVDLLLQSGGDPIATTATAPFTLSWDTTSAPDGVTELVARVTDTAGKTADANFTVLVMNTGVEVTYTDGSSGTMSIPSLDVDTDIKHHWTNPAGVGRILAIATLTPGEGETWQIEQTIGMGFCPHSGTTLAGTGAVVEVTGPETRIVTWTPAEMTLSEGQHFVHLRADDAPDHIGGALPYTFNVYLVP